MVAYGRAAERDDDVSIFCKRALDGGLNQRLAVGNDAIVRYSRAAFNGESSCSVAVGRNDLVRASRIARGNKFVACGDDDDMWPSNDGNTRMPAGSGEGQGRRIKNAARRQDHVIFREIEPAPPYMSASNWRLFKVNAAFRTDFDVFLHDNGVCAFRHGRSRENAHGLTWRQCA